MDCTSAAKEVGKVSMRFFDQTPFQSNAPRVLLPVRRQPASRILYATLQVKLLQVALSSTSDSLLSLSSLLTSLTLSTQCRNSAPCTWWQRRQLKIVYQLQKLFWKPSLACLQVNSLVLPLMQLSTPSRSLSRKLAQLTQPPNWSLIPGITKPAYLLQSMY